MADSKLPTVREAKLANVSHASSVEALKGLRTNRALLAGGIAASVGAVALFLITQHIIFSAVLTVAGMVFFGSRQLVKKSLALTSASSKLQLGSVDQQLEQMKKQVSKCKFLENVEVEGSRAASQADQLIHQYKNLKNVLSVKFEPTEITFSRYVDSIDASCLSIGENLVHTKGILENLNLTKSDQSPQRIESQTQVKKLLEINDEALESLAQLFNSINEITTKERHRDQLEESMQQIRELADRAKIYSKH